MKDTSTYGAALADEKKVLETELESVGRRNASNPADWEAVPQETGQESDPNDRADLMEHLGENTAILNDLEIRYNIVLAALERIEKGTYGICEIGGEEIEEARLAADPAAATCKAHMNA
ncbi:MAG: TraR/DksA family transcriptional regulator [Parcubacteria group bacterium]|nr:TraR/DksA family transcriptional regulator [Parcubacteria group bacterium]